MTQSASLANVLNGPGITVRYGFNASLLALVTESEGSSSPSPTYSFMMWRNDTAKLLRRRNAANSGWEIIENYGATTNPGVGDDAADGYIEGSTWINTSGNKWFVCTDQTTGAAIWKEAGGDRISVKAYGAVGDGTTSDQTAIQNAFTAAASANKLVDLGAGTYRCTAAITATNLRGVVGDGKSIAALVWDDTTDGGIAITYTGNCQRKAAIFRDFALRQKGARGTALLLDYSAYSLTYPGTDTRFVVENVVAEGTGDDTVYGWDIGFDALAGANGTFVNSDFIGFSDSGTFSAAGFRFRGTGTQYDNGHPVSCHIFNCLAYFAQTAFWWDGVEGAIARDCNAVDVDNGYLFDGGDIARPQLVMEGCHANFNSTGIVCDAGVDVTLTKNLLYTMSTSPNSDTTGIGLVNFGSVSSVGHFLINDNVFCDLKSTKAMTCIYVGPNTVATGIIDCNIFRTGKVGISLDTGATGVRVGKGNIYSSLSSSTVIDSGSSNIVGAASLATSGMDRNINGTEVKWGVSSVSLDSSGNGSITYPAAFSTATLSGTVSFSSPSYTGPSGSVPVADIASSTASVLAVSVRPNPGAVGISISYVVVGY